MRIGIRAGHNVYNNGVFDVGAVGVGVTEAKFVKDTVAEFKRLCDADVVDVTPYNERFKRAKDHHSEMHTRAYKLGVDLLVDVHMNSSKSGLGNGVECFVFPGSVSEKYAQSICKEISKYGLRNRGVKEHRTFWSLVLGSTPTIIVEGGFINNAGDMGKLTPRRYAEALVRGLGLEFKSVSSGGGTNKSKKKVVDVSEGSKILFNDVDKRISTYNVSGYNYIKVRDLEKLGFEVRYSKGVVYVEDKPGNKFVVDGRDVGVVGVLRDSVNYVPIRNVADILGYDVRYTDGVVYLDGVM